MLDFKKYGYFVIVFGLLASLLVFYTAYDKTTKTLSFDKLAGVLLLKDVANSFKEFNKVISLAAIGLISIVFLFGPLSKVWPKVFNEFLVLRKPLGLTGFIFALGHVVFSVIVFYNLSLDKIFFQNPKMLALASGFIALFMFFLMTVTSTQKMVARLGYKNWKVLQTFGYVALFLAVAHFFILESKPVIGFDVRPFGALFLVIAIIALVARIAIVFLRVPERKSFKEHVGLKR